MASRREISGEKRIRSRAGITSKALFPPAPWRERETLKERCAQSERMAMPPRRIVTNVMRRISSLRTWASSWAITP